ncbi:hypothetical protein C0J52_12877 [Blattella germanica]|nr:hypothetical protein C0J52_12877 [Blattella germanica]PSN42279.1 hypothetical protein C0J52_12877 [Blattella germanica]
MTMERKLFWISITLLYLVRTSEFVSNSISTIATSTKPSIEEIGCKQKYRQICIDSKDNDEPMITCIDLSKTETLIFNRIQLICDWMSKCLEDMNGGNLISTYSDNYAKREYIS